MDGNVKNILVLRDCSRFRYQITVLCKAIWFKYNFRKKNIPADIIKWLLAKEVADFPKYPERSGSHSQAVGRACDVTCRKLDSERSAKIVHVSVSLWDSWSMVAHSSCVFHAFTSIIYLNSSFTNFALMRKLPSFTNFAFMRILHV